MHVEKIPVMVVDDDKIILDELICRYDWNGFDIVATAINGVQALALFNQLRPKLVITDIVMPGKNGIDLLKEIKAIDSSTIVILLTSHDDFAYAKQGIQYAANDYILKSEISTETLSSKLGKVIKTLQKEEQSINFLKQKILNDLFRLKYRSVLSYYPDSTNMGVFLHSTNFYYVIIEMKTLLFASAPETYINEALLEKIVSFRTTELYCAVCTGISDRHILVLLKAADLKSQATAHNIVYRYCGRLIDVLGLKTSPSVTILYSSVARPLDQFYEYITTLGIEHRFLGRFNRDNSLIDMLTLSINNSPTPIAPDMEELRGYMETGDIEALRKWFHSILKGMSGCQGYDIYTDIATSVYSVVDSIVYHISFEHNSFPPVYSYDDFFDWCIKLLDKHFQLMNGRSINNPSMPTKLTIEYIKEHYANAKLSISDIAENVFLSSGYLCTLFKAETGKSINEYMTDVRMSKAQKLLQDPSKKIYQVAQFVGYSSSQYFSQIFQKHTGMTPKQFRKINRRD